MEDKKNIEIVLKPQEEESAQINFRALGKRFRHMKQLSVRLLAGALALGIVAGIGVTIFKSTSEAYTLVNFGYDGIEQGLAPNGSTFDITKMEDAIIVQPAIDELGLKITPEDFRQATRFEGVIPQDALDKISVIQTISDKNPQALEELLDVSYHPTQYKLTVDLRKLGINTSQGSALLDAVTNSYYQWFLKSYGEQEALSSAVGSTEYSEYDYGEAADIFGTQLITAIRYVQAMQSKDANYRSTQTGLTFADLLSQLSTLRQVDLAKLNAVISANGITKNKETLAAYYQYQIQTATDELGAAVEKQASLEKAVNTYQKDTAVVYGDSTESSTITAASQAYDSLVNQKVDMASQVADIRARVKELQRKYNELMSVEVVQNPDPQAEKTAQALIDGLKQKLNDTITLINTSAQEFYQTVAYKNAFSVQIPGKAAGSGGILHIIQNLLICIIIFEVLAGVIIIVHAVVSTLVVGELFKTRKDRSEVSEAD